LDSYDAVIVGAGPAGASAGFFLRRLNPDLGVLLIDRLDGKKYDRYHRMCGEGISKAAFNELAPLQPEHIVHTITKAREVWPGGIAFEGWVEGYIIDRPAFLRGILDRYRASGDGYAHDAVERIEREASGSYIIALTSGRTVRCRYLIGADGARSAVRRALFREEAPITVWADQYLVDKKLDGDREFPAGDKARIGFPRGVDPVPEDVVEVHRRSIPMGGLNRIVEGNAMLVGDAAAMANPLTAGGIRVALLSGRRAAEAIACGDPRRYQEWWSSSPFARRKYVNAFRKFEMMSDQDYVRAAKPFGKPYSLARMAWAYLTMPEYRSIYLAYISSDRDGW